MQPAKCIPLRNSKEIYSNMDPTIKHCWNCTRPRKSVRFFGVCVLPITISHCFPLFLFVPSLVPSFVSSFPVADVRLGFAHSDDRREHAIHWFGDQMSNIFMNSWTAEYITYQKISCPELHEYPEGVVKGSIAMGGQFLNMLNPQVKKNFQQLINSTIQEDLRRLRLCGLQVQLKSFTTELVSAVGEEYKTWGWMLPYFCAVLEDLDCPTSTTNIAGPTTPEEVDVPVRQGGTWTVARCLAFLNSRMCSTDRTYYQDMDYFPQMYANTSAETGTIIAAHAKYLVKENWNKQQTRIEALPSRLIGFFAAVHALTALAMHGTSSSASIAEMKLRSAWFASTTNDVDSCMRPTDCPSRRFAIFRKAVFGGTLMHAFQVERLGSMHFLNEQDAEKTFQFSKSVLRKNSSIKPDSLMRKIERQRNAIRFEITTASRAQQVRDHIEATSVEASVLMMQAAVEEDFNLLVSSTQKLSHVSDATTKQRKVYKYQSIDTFVVEELGKAAVAVISIWYSSVSNHVYVETTTSEEKPVQIGGVGRFLTELRIGKTAHRTTMKVRERTDVAYHAWSAFVLPNTQEEITGALTRGAAWVDVTLMGLTPAMALRHPQKPSLFFFQTLRGRQKKEGPSWVL
jgi:hypothetical protein